MTAGILPTPRWIAWTAATAVVLIAALYAFHRLEQFLITDARFVFADPAPEAGSAYSRDVSSETLIVSGSTHASARAVEAVFAGDTGRSVYLIPLAERRASLRNVDWVKDATVARFWPNRVVVGIRERKPVAFINPESAAATGKDSAAGREMIDEEGMLLPPTQDRFTLPLLIGVGASDDLKTRHDGVQRMIGLMRDLAEASPSVISVDVSDSDNLKIKEPFHGHTVTLLLGDGHFALRHRHFIAYYGQIEKEAPWASVLDLRVEDRITAVNPAQGPVGKETVVK